MMSEKKERKYVECFKSVLDGSCNWCKSRSWKKGNKIYAMRIPAGKWVVCSDKKCYLEQGGKLTEFLTTVTEPPKPNDSSDTVQTISQRDEIEVLIRTIENLEIEQSVIQKRLDRKRERLTTLRRND